jgi:hypothetical protein
MATKREVFETEAQRAIGQQSPKQLGDRCLTAIVAADDECCALLEADLDIAEQPEILNLGPVNSHAFTPLNID